MPKTTNQDKKALLIHAGQTLYGERWQTDLARSLGFSEARRVRQWISDERQIPDLVITNTLTLLEDRKAKIEECINNITANIPS